MGVPISSGGNNPVWYCNTLVYLTKIFRLNEQKQLNNAL